MKQNQPSKPYHIFIIWNNSLIKKDIIIYDIKNRFQLKMIFEVTWSSNLFLDNLRRFYGATLPDPQKKLKDCGAGKFLVILVQDHNPTYIENGTGLKKKLVNANVFDSKMIYRKWLGVDFAIHGSNTQKETKHDLILLFGKSLFEIIEELPTTYDNRIKKISRDLVGSGGWSSLQEIFHILNNSTNYLVLRNFENLTDHNQLKNIKDIDILTDDFWQISYIVNKKLRKKDETGPSSYVEVDNKRIKFDFKTPGDGYYDKHWEEKLLEKRELSKNGIYVPDKENYFFSLLYHMLIHKRKLNQNYVKILENLSKDLNINEFSTFSNNTEKLKILLDVFLRTNNYSYTHTRRYRLHHNEFLRLVTNALKISQRQGIKKLFRATKDKFYRRKLIRSGKI